MKRNRFENKNAGITLIAIVVTIIILLILSGVTISTISGKNGILTKARLAKQLSEAANEKEAIELIVSSFSIDKLFNKTSEYYIGKELASQNLNNIIYDVILIKDSNQNYGNDWNYIAEETYIKDYGNTKYGWLVNYNTSEIIQLEKDNYIELSSEKGLAVKDGLLFNMDAANVNIDLESWGNNVSLFYYDSNIYNTMEKRNEAYQEQVKYDNVNNKEYKGYDRNLSDTNKDYLEQGKNAFKFNGNNYIEIYNEKGFDFSNGFTLEFYGNIEDFTQATMNSNFYGMLGIWDGIYANQCKTRLGYTSDTNNIFYSLILESCSDYGSWGEDSGHLYNQIYPISDFIKKDVYLTITFNPSNEKKVIQTIYINGEKIAEGWLGNAYYSKFVNNSKMMKYIELGRCTISQPSNWAYMKGTCYTSRIYNRALTDDEVSKNVDQTKLYRQTLMN